MAHIISTTGEQDEGHSGQESFPKSRRAAGTGQTPAALPLHESLHRATSWLCCTEQKPGHQYLR